MQIFHCCVQKTGSQWLKALLGDEIITKKMNMTFVTLDKNYLEFKNAAEIPQINFLPNSFISPFYVNYADFLKVKMNDAYKAFFVLRDPRDILVSFYYSIVFSHRSNPFVESQRSILSQMDKENAFNYILNNLLNPSNHIYKAMTSWFSHGGRYNQMVMVVKYEELVGETQFRMFKTLFDFLTIPLTENELSFLLDKHSFKRMSGGREVGEENETNHYRKGIVGDWKNHFSEINLALFKTMHGRLLIELEYEDDMSW